jgi:hypothetical protein
VSSLHCIEHLGLRRYNDPPNLNGHEICIFVYLNLYQIVGIYMSVFLLAKRLLNLTYKGLLITVPEKILKNFKLEEFVLILCKGAPKFLPNPKDVDKQIWY